MIDELLNEGGKAVGASSQVPKEMLEKTIENGLKNIGLTGIDFQPVGNLSSRFLGDLDIALSVEDLAKKWNLPKPYFSEQFWEVLKRKLLKIKDADIQVGLKQFSIPVNLVDNNGVQQPAYKDGQPIPDSQGIVQVDFFIGSPKWMKDMLSGKPEASKYKAIYRNVLLGSIISTIDRKTTEPDAKGFFKEFKYVLDFKNGVEKVTTTFSMPTGRRKNPKKESVQRKTIITDQNKMAEWLFGKGSTWQTINSFEEVLKQFEQNKYFNKKYSNYKEEILEKFKETLKPDQLEALQASDMGNLFKESINEGRESIGRFSGKQEFSNAEFLKLLQKLVEETGNAGKSSFTIDLLEDPSVDMVEKMDASFIHFGVNKDGKFFMESNYSGEVTLDNAQEVFGFRKESIDSFMYLQNNKKFQTALQQIFKTYGPIRFDSEMFPVFTHEGSKSGDVVFASTRYRKEKFGKFGGSVVFKCSKWSEEKGEWIRPEPSVSSEIISNFKKISSGFQGEWKIYSNDEDMRLPGVIKVELDQLAEYITPENIGNTLSILRKKDSPEKDAILSMIATLRTQLQDALNNYADKASSKLGDKNSNVEGVVLRVKAKDGEVFEVKGTSQKFTEQAKIIWEDRKKSEDAKEEFLNSVKLTVLQLPKSPDKNILSSLDKAIKDSKMEAPTREKYLQFAIQSIVPNISSALQTMEKDLNVAIYKAREEIKSIVKSINNKKGVLDSDSERKSFDYTNNFTKLLNDYEIIGTSKGAKEKKYFALLEKYFGGKLQAIVPNPSQKPEKEVAVEPVRIILWNGRAQPWHKGHDAMIQLGKNKLASLKADKVVIMIVKGGKSSKDLSENPLNEKEQYDLVSAIYKNDKQVDVVEKFPSNVFGVLDLVSKNNYMIVGWLAGEDRIGEYQNVINKFDAQRFLTDHATLAIYIDEKTQEKKVSFIKTERLFSGTKSRTLIKDPNVTFEQWLKTVAPSNLSSEAKKEYEKVYNIIKERVPDNIQEIVLSTLQEHIVKRKNKFCLLSKKSGKNLGCYRSRKGAKKREKQVQYFKHLKEMSGMAADSVAVAPAKPEIKEDD